MRETLGQGDRDGQDPQVFGKREFSYLPESAEVE